MGARLVAVMVVAVALAGPFQSLALAQQTPQAQQLQGPQSQPQPELIQSGTQAQVTPPESRREGNDIYDVGAGFFTVVGMPLKAISCAAGAVFGLGLFVGTLGSADRGATAAVEEGCHQRWIVHGNDIRPEGSRRDRMRYRYDGDLR